jgi:hypothetical protein
MKGKMTLSARTREEKGKLSIELLAFPAVYGVDVEEMFEDAYKSFKEARQKVGGFLRVEGVKDKGRWPPVMEFRYRYGNKKGYMATIAGPEKCKDSCLKELQELGYDTPR